MGWSTPATWVAGTVVTASDMNTYIRDNQRYLKGIGQVPTIESGLTIDNTDGDERLLLPLLSTAECNTALNAEGEVAFDEQTHQMKEYDGTAVRAIISEADVDDTPVDSATTVPISSNWAYDHVAAADPHTGYVLESLLTTQGDIAYATADSTWQRLAKGTASQYLWMNAGATAPEWTTLSSILASKIKVDSRGAASATGDVGYTGIGFQPTAIICLATVAGTSQLSIGFADSALAETCIYKIQASTVYQTADGTFIRNDSDGGTGMQTAVLKTMDADGFTLTWTKTGGGGNNTVLIFLCLR